MKYRKKPVVIEAEQWFPEKEIEDVLWDETVMCSASSERGIEHTRAVVQPYIQTLEGKMYVSPGDWIITGVKGEKYPCKPDIFEATYEKVD